MGRDTRAEALQDIRISIHPSRVGWDQTGHKDRRSPLDFNPPIPCGMGLKRMITMLKRIAFQSTHPVWDGTPTSWVVFQDTFNFNPPIPCGMGRRQAVSCCRFVAFQSTHPVWDGTALSLDHLSRALISIHPSRVGWDTDPVLIRFSDHSFQSTHPVWDGTQRQRVCVPAL